MKHSKEAIDAQIEKAAAARSNASIGAENAWDYIEHAGMKFYRPQLAHVWLLMAVIREKTDITKHWPIVLGFILAHNQEETRNKLVGIALQGRFVERAYQFVMENNLSPDELTEITGKLGKDLETQKKRLNQEKESSPSGGRQ